MKINKKVSIVFFGDSICFGQGISIHKGWVPRLSAKIEEMAAHKGSGAFIANSSVNGNTTRLALERMPYEIQGHSYDIMICQFGMNDCNYWKTDKGVPRVSKRAFEANLHEIIDRALNFGIKKVILNTNHPTTRNSSMENTSITYEESNKAYNDLIRNVASQRSEAILNDIEKKIADYVKKYNISASSIVLDDGLHLSLLGHDLYYDLSYPYLEKVIVELSK